MRWNKPDNNLSEALWQDGGCGSGFLTLLACSIASRANMVSMLKIASHHRMTCQGTWVCCGCVCFEIYIDISLVFTFCLYCSVFLICLYPWICMYACIIFSCASQFLRHHICPQSLSVMMTLSSCPFHSISPSKSSILCLRQRSRMPTTLSEIFT